MFGCRTATGVGSCALALALLFGCGGATSHGPDDGFEPVAGQPGQSGGKGGRASTGGSSQAGVGGSTGGSRNLGGGGAGTDPPPVETGCQPEDLPPPSLECDAFGPNTCGAGYGCFPFVIHPEGSGCDAQSYGTICRPAGTGTQGARCGDADEESCAAGHVCVVGQRAGKRCAELCKVGMPNQCAGGLICGDLDVSGYGVCG